MPLPPGVRRLRPVSALDVSLAVLAGLAALAMIVPVEISFARLMRESDSLESWVGWIIVMTLMNGWFLAMPLLVVGCTWLVRVHCGRSDHSVLWRDSWMAQLIALAPVIVAFGVVAVYGLVAILLLTPWWSVSVPALYPLVMLAALGVGLWLARPRQARWALSAGQRWAVALGAFTGGMLGAKLPFALADPRGVFCTQAWFSDGKTILFGLVGGYLGVEIAKALAGVRVKTGDGFAVPVAAAIGVGRLGCFLGKCCYGLPTSLPWGVDFGDGVRRHPTQLYELVFHLGAAVVLVLLERRGLFPRQRFKLYLAAYCVYRFLTEFLRPEVRLWGGLTGYQYAALALLPLIAALWRQDRAPTTESA